MATTTVYSRPEFASVDIGSAMRQGHPFISAGDQYIIDLLVAKCARRDDQPRIFEIGAGSGVLSELLNRQLPRAEIVANEVEPALVALAEQRVKSTSVQVFSRPFDEWEQELDFIVSWGSHHHLTNDYIEHARRLLKPNGVFIIGD